MSSLKLIAISGKNVSIIDLVGLTALGGNQCSGQIIDGLKYKDDYVIISPQENALELHVLKGKFRSKNIQLKYLEQIDIGDLKLIAIQDQSGTELLTTQQDDFSPVLLKLLDKLSTDSQQSVIMELVLQEMITKFSMNRGLIITRDIEDKFQLCVQKGVESDEEWLSEHLIKQVIERKESYIIQNIYGSAFEESKSLIATGFLSVFAWPLLLRGECMGVLIIGSNQPHSGLSKNEMQQAEIMTHLASQALYFHLRDERAQRSVEKLKETSLLYSCPIITQDEKLQDQCTLARQIAPTELGVLIEGETGVGKEVMARWIHQQSGRVREKFIAVNCGAIPENLLESILYGHRKGAFTGANSNQIGKFQLADRGTIFLDEIGDLPEHLQVKLLRVLQEKEVEPIGAGKAIPINVRVVAASHKSLPTLVAQGKFREDLFYRLAEIHLQIPPLRERCADIPMLVDHFLRQENSTKQISPRAWHWLEKQEWKGNVRELFSFVKRAAVLAMGDEIEQADFLRGRPQGLVTESEGDNAWLGAVNLEKAKQKFIIQKVRKALELSHGKRNDAAELLGVTPRTLFRYLEEIKNSELRN